MNTLDFPYHFSGLGRTATTNRDDNIRDLIEQALFTAPGERVMQPDYGAAVLTFEPVDPDRFAIAIRQSIAEHEPRVSSADVSVALGQSVGEVIVRVDYELVGEATVQTLTYPFFIPSGT